MQLLVGVEQALLSCSSYLCDNMHVQMPNIHMQQHHVHETLHCEDLFEHHNAVPDKKYAYYHYQFPLLCSFYLSNKMPRLPLKLFFNGWCNINKVLQIINNSKQQNQNSLNPQILYISLWYMCKIVNITFTTTGTTLGRLAGKSKPLRPSSAKAKQPPCHEPSLWKKC